MLTYERESKKISYPNHNVRNQLYCRKKIETEINDSKVQKAKM